MTRILHCADLHLSVQEKVYSLSVLSEITGLAIEMKANLLLFAGDTFDSFAYAEALRGDFKRMVATIIAPDVGFARIQTGVRSGEQ